MKEEKRDIFKSSFTPEVLDSGPVNPRYAEWKEMMKRVRRAIHFETRKYYKSSLRIIDGGLTKP
jgi:hypothetical protein